MYNRLCDDGLSPKQDRSYQGKSRRYLCMYSKKKKKKKKKKKVNFDSRFAWRLNRKEKISLQIVLLPILLLIYMERVYLS